MAKGVTVDLIVDPKKAIEGLEKLSNKANDSSSFLTGLGKVGTAAVVGLGVAVAAAAAGATALAVSSVKAFAELEQNLGGSEAVFGQFANTIQTTGANAYKTLGISQSEYLSTANKMGSLFQGSGLTQQRSLDLTTQAMQRAADMASVMGIETSVAMEAVAGAAKGNFTMMDNLGVAMNATTLKAYALEQGINFDWNTASQAEKSELAMKMFFDRTTQYAGNFEKEATETISGSMGMLRASVASLSAGLGDANADISLLVGNVVDSFSAVVKNIGPVLENIAAAAPEAISGLIDGLSAALPGVLKLGTSLIGSLIGGLVKALPGIVPVAMDALVTLTTTILGMLPTLLDTGMKVLITLVKGIAAALPQLIPAAVAAVIGLVQALIQNLPLLLDAGLQLIMGLAQGLVTAIPQLIAALPELIISIVQFLVDSIPILIDAGIDLFLALIEALPDIIVGIVAAIPKIITGLVTALTGAIPKIIDAGIRLFIALIENLPTIIVEIVKAVPQIITGLVNALSASIPQIVAMGGQLISGLWNGIVGAGDWLWRQIRNFFGGIIDNIRGLLGIHSPSTLFAGMGVNLVQGLEVGLQKPNHLTAITRDLSGQVTSGFDADLAVRTRAVFASPDGDVAAPGASSSMTLVYHAAPNQSLSAEQDLWRAMERFGSFA